jgi:Na+/H+-translocating membrane pyrophosphatase
MLSDIRRQLFNSHHYDNLKPNSIPFVCPHSCSLQSMCGYTTLHLIRKVKGHASLYQSFKQEIRLSLVKFEVFTAVTMKNGVFWDVAQCGSCTSNIIFLLSVLRLLVTANVVPTSRTYVTLMMEAICSSETSVLTRVTRRNIPEVCSPQSAKQNVPHCIFYLAIRDSQWV